MKGFTKFIYRIEGKELPVRKKAAYVSLPDNITNRGLFLCVCAELVEGDYSRHFGINEAFQWSSSSVEFEAASYYEGEHPSSALVDAARSWLEQLGGNIGVGTEEMVPEPDGTDLFFIMDECSDGAEW